MLLAVVDWSVVNLVAFSISENGSAGATLAWWGGMGTAALVLGLLGLSWGLTDTKRFGPTRWWCVVVAYLIAVLPFTIAVEHF
ncbi:hypothetical protein ACFO4E_15630 [Nocardiopsis mangrovi]|uniref:Uncharacterized protein n=1 Tax=Nocardiopsis mangrovi TaxID=1179818 RepID=A0ABV9E130_9ACTN